MVQTPVPWISGACTDSLPSVPSLPHTAPLPRCQMLYKNHPKQSGLWLQIPFYGQELRKGLAGRFWLEVSQEVAVGWCLEQWGAGPLSARGLSMLASGVSSQHGSLWAWAAFSLTWPWKSYTVTSVVLCPNSHQRTTPF